MIVVTVARKPLGQTVALSTQQHGTGALNIDACRLPVGDGEQLSVPQSSPSRRQGVVGRDLGITNTQEAAFQRAQEESIARTMAMGRWPANLILSSASAADVDNQMGPVGNHTARVALFDNAQKATSYNIAPEGHFAYDYGDKGPVSRFFKVVEP
jgi:hypothetical protein